MEDEIKIGSAVLDYVESMGEIGELLQDACIYAATCTSSIQNGDTYKGIAKEEIELFFWSLNSHLQKMCLLYQAASTYLSNAYIAHYYNEEQIIDRIINRIGETK